MDLAASALYVACALEGKKTAQRDVAEAADVTEFTIGTGTKVSGWRSMPGPSGW